MRIHVHMSTWICARSLEESLENSIRVIIPAKPLVLAKLSCVHTSMYMTCVRARVRVRASVSVCIQTCMPLTC